MNKRSIIIEAAQKILSEKRSFVSEAFTPDYAQAVKHIKNSQKAQDEYWNHTGSSWNRPELFDVHEAVRHHLFNAHRHLNELKSDDPNKIKLKKALIDHHKQSAERHGQAVTYDEKSKFKSHDYEMHKHAVEWHKGMLNDLQSKTTDDGDENRGAVALGEAGSRGPRMADVVHPWLKERGFDHTTNTEHETSRYVKRGFYDGDYPNAHQSKVTTVTHWFRAKDPDGAHFHALHSHLKKSGVGVTKKIRVERLKMDNYSGVKGNHTFNVTHKNGKTTVSHSIRSTKPDVEFERSGRGRGQII